MGGAGGGPKGITPKAEPGQRRQGTVSAKGRGGSLTPFLSQPPSVIITARCRQAPAPSDLDASPEGTAQLCACKRQLGVAGLTYHDPSQSSFSPRSRCWHGGFCWMRELRFLVPDRTFHKHTLLAQNSPF